MIGFGEIQYRISAFEGGLMIAVGAIYDLTQFALTWLLGWIGVGFIGTWLVTIWAGMTFGLWFTLKGAGIMSGKRAASLGLGAIVEAIPILNALPGWTLAVIISLAATRAEDLLASSSLPIAPLAKKVLRR